MSSDRPARSGRMKMADIARLAGVSVSTVSRALADSPLVTEETRQRIKQAVGETGYVINHVASGLRLQRSRQILVMLPSIANPFFAELVLGIEEEAQARGFGVLVGNTSGAQAREEALARHLLTGAVDGLILLTGRMPALLAGIAAIEDRVVAVSERIPGAGVATVSIDHVAGARDAVAHLAALGHRRIAHIAGPVGSILTAQRIKGFRQAMTEANLPVEEASITFGNFTFDSGEAALRILLAIDPRPSAVFCSNDEMAIGAIKAARALGLRVPEDLSVVGFDDIHFAGVYDPPLTTIHQPRRAIGRTAASLLFDQLAHKRAQRRHTELRHSLVVRDSAAVAREASPRRASAKTG
jgi:LacI family transcriptional regulator, repressor for deo operon, udp, cdd, tsx, nupC, and nupG